MKEILTSNVKEIFIKDYDYQLPEERIAKYPLPERDLSKLLVYRNSSITESVFRRLPELLPEGSLIVFNNTRVIRARLLFRKETGARIEIFCLEPEEPRDYAQNFQARSECCWNCLVGNRKRWNTGVLTKSLTVNGETTLLSAELIKDGEQCSTVRFRWDNTEASFAEILDAAGVLPVPPYLKRETETADLTTYQTVYSKVKGSVAAPTAGLHFTDEVIDNLKSRNIKIEELTLHVGAGTFKPVQSNTIRAHDMHAEFFSVSKEAITGLIKHTGQITAVGTTAVRTLESLYHIGIQLTASTQRQHDIQLQQWAPYLPDLPNLTVQQALENIMEYLEKNSLEALTASTKIIIVPGYRFRLVNRMLTNFHQPRSTLLLLVSAFVGDKARKSIYDYALTHDFRFLSYGDSSLLQSE